MIFWDASALVPLYVKESNSAALQSVAKKDSDIVVWWGSLIECYSAVARRRKEKFLSPDQEDQIRKWLTLASAKWTELQPSDEIRGIAAQLLLRHPLHAAESLQLAAAILWAEKAPRGQSFACLDTVLREAARKEGFVLLPISP